MDNQTTVMEFLGIASDPQKVAIFREISRQRARALQDNSIDPNDPRFMEFRYMLILSYLCIECQLQSPVSESARTHVFGLYQLLLK